MRTVKYLLSTSVHVRFASTAIHVPLPFTLGAGICCLGAASAQAVQYSVTNLGSRTPSSNSTGDAINVSGQVSVVDDSTGWGRTYLYTQGVMQDLGTLGGHGCWGLGINASGHVAGYSDTAGDATQHAFLYSGGAMQDLGTLGGQGSWGRDINDSDQVTGYSYTSGTSPLHAFIYSVGSMQDLGTLGGTRSWGWSINAAGHVAGSSDIAGNPASHAFLYNGSSMQDLGTLGGTSSSASGINASDQVVGSSNTVGVYEHAFLYSGGRMQDLGTLGGTRSWANAINRSGQVVGYSLTGNDSAYHAFIYSGGVLQDLNDLIAPGSGLTLVAANDINDNGWITGIAASEWGNKAFLLTPIPEPATLALLALGALLLRRHCLHTGA